MIGTMIAPWISRIVVGTLVPPGRATTRGIASVTQKLQVMNTNGTVTSSRDRALYISPSNAGRVSRTHDDLDLAVWAEDHHRIARLLVADGWTHAPDDGEDGYTGYERGGVRLELAFLERGEGGDIYTPLEDGRGSWPDDAFGDDVAELEGVRARVIGVGALRADKSEAHEDPRVAAKDRADLAALDAARQK